MKHSKKPLKAGKQRKQPWQRVKDAEMQRLVLESIQAHNLPRTTNERQEAVVDLSRIARVETRLEQKRGKPVKLVRVTEKTIHWKPGLDEERGTHKAVHTFVQSRAARAMVHSQNISRTPAANERQQVIPGSRMRWKLATARGASVPEGLRRVRSLARSFDSKGVLLAEDRFTILEDEHGREVASEEKLAHDAVKARKAFKKR